MCAAEKKTAKKPKRLSPEFRTRLLAEAESPWRTFRKFIYGSFALSATVGGVTALTQLAAAATGQPDALPIQQAALNVGVDFGVVAACAYGLSVDGAADAGVEAADAAPVRPVSDDAAALAANLDALGRLRVTVAGSRVADVATLQAAARQGVVVVGGPSDVVDDALRDAIIEQKALAAGEVLVVPVRTASSDGGSGGKTANTYGFVAPPLADDSEKWRAYVAAEVAVAEGQGAETAGVDGVVVAVRSDGTVARRGLGKPVWKMVLADLAKEDAA